MKKDAIGIIDTGSNTVLGVIFRWDSEKNCYRCFSLEDGLTVHAGLIRYVENGVMSADGLKQLGEALCQIHTFFVFFFVCPEDVRCFATASLRGVTNFSEAAEVAENWGYQLELLSGEEEAACDFEGMLQEMGWMEQAGASFPEQGVALDMGGGSGQLLCFTSRKQKKLADFRSMPIGCLAVKKRLVSGDGSAPSEQELQEIDGFIRSQIEQIPMIAALPETASADAPAFFVMGGTVKTIVRLFERLGWSVTDPNCPGSVTLQAEDLQKSLEYFRSPDGIAMVSRYETGRRETLVTGIQILLSICRRIGARQMTVLQSGVREGYVLRHC